MNKAQVYRNGPKHWAWEHHCPGRTHPATGFPYSSHWLALWSANMHMQYHEKFGDGAVLVIAQHQDFG